MPGFGRSLIAIVIVGGIAGLGYYAATRGAGTPAGGAPSHAGAPPPASVNVARVLSRDIQEWSEFSGRLVPVDQVDVRPRVKGIIEAVHFKDGAFVGKGALLFTIDQRPYAAEVNRAEAAVASALAQATMTRTTLGRAQSLIKEQAIPRTEYDQRRNDAAVAEANVRSARAAVAAARLNLEFTRVRAPIAGRAGRVEVTAGNMVDTGMTDPPLTTIVSTDPIYADFEVDEGAYLQYAHAGGGSTGLPVLLGLASETDTPRRGHIQSFDNRLNSTSGTIRARAVFSNGDGKLVPGMFARIKLGGAGKTRAALISDRAVGTDQNKKFVLIVGPDNKVVYREITLGPMADGLRIVRKGLKTGERIIVQGLQRARPGQQVKPELVRMDLQG